MKPTSALRSFLIGSSVLATATSLHAVDRYWDTNGTASGFGSSPAGNWGTSAFWSSGANASIGTETPATATTTTSDNIFFGSSTHGFDTSAQVLFNSAKNAGNITFGSANTAAVVINNGTALTLAAASVITVNTSSGGSIAGQISGAATSLTKEGTGTLSLSGNASNYAGATIINAGTINAQEIENGGTAGSSIGSSTNAAANLVLNGGTLSKFGTLTGTTDRLFTLGDNGGGLSNIGSVENLVFNSAGSIVATGAANRTLTLGGTFSTGTGNSLAPVLANASGGGLVSVVKSGANSWTLSGATNSYSGGTTVSAGTLTMGSASALGSTSGQLTVNGGTLNMAGQNLTVGNLTGTGGVISGTSGTRTLTIGQGDTGGGNFQGAIQNGAGGTTALTKTGNGTMTLSGTNTYTGATTISGGILAVNGSLANTTTTIQSGGTLQGSGTIGGSITVQNGGTLAAGNSIESLATGTLNLDLGSTFAYEMDKSVALSAGGDLTAVTGDLNITAGAFLTLTELDTLSSGSWAVGETLTLISYTGAWNNGLFTYLGDPLTDGETFSYSGATWEFDYNDNLEGSNFASDSPDLESYVTITAIPEPGATLLGGLGLLALLRRRRN